MPGSILEALVCPSMSEVYLVFLVAVPRQACFCRIAELLRVEHLCPACLVWYRELYVWRVVDDSVVCTTRFGNVLPVLIISWAEVVWSHTSSIGESAACGFGLIGFGQQKRV